MTFLTILRVTETLCSFKLILEGKTGKEIPESSRLEFLEKCSGNNFALSDAEDNTSGPMNRGDIADLPFLRTLLAIHQKSWEQSFCNCFSSLKLWLNKSELNTLASIRYTLYLIDADAFNSDLFATCQVA